MFLFQFPICVQFTAQFTYSQQKLLTHSFATDRKFFPELKAQLFTTSLMSAKRIKEHISPLIFLGKCESCRRSNAVHTFRYSEYCLLIHFRHYNGCTRILYLLLFCQHFPTIALDLILCWANSKLNLC